MLFFLLLLMVELSIDMVVLSVFPHPGFKFLACSYSDRECQEGKRVRYRDWESLYLLAVLFRGSKPSRFCQYWDFSNIYWWFWNIFNFFLFFFLFCFCRLLLLLCFGLHFAVLFVAFEFCDFDVSVKSPPIRSLLLLCSSFLYGKKEGESFLKPDDILTCYFSCSWAHRFVVFVFGFLCSSLFPISLYFCWWQCQVFFGCYFFLTRWCWVDEGSFDSWGSSMRSCFQRGWTDIFPLAGI